jgi:hypothetical protein
MKSYDFVHCHLPEEELAYSKEQQFERQIFYYTDIRIDHLVVDWELAQK